MAIAFFKLVPAFGEKRTIIVEADEQDVRSPSQAIADVKWWGLAARKPFLAIGTVVVFAGKPDASFNIHGDTSGSAWLLVSVKGGICRFTGAPILGAIALSAREVGDE